MATAESRLLNGLGMPPTQAATKSHDYEDEAWAAPPPGCRDSNGKPFHVRGKILPFARFFFFFFQFPCPPSCPWAKHADWCLQSVGVSVPCHQVDIRVIIDRLANVDTVEGSASVAFYLVGPYLP